MQYTIYQQNSNIIEMDSNTGFIWNPSALDSVYYHQAKENHNDFLDLGLSLKTLEPEEAHEWHQINPYQRSSQESKWHQINPYQRSSPESSGYTKNAPKESEEEGDGVQSKERWAYVKVNMDRVVVGRKICLPHYGGYSNLAHELEDMFGRQSESGLRLFQAGSQFSLFYLDRDENWRTVGDVSWKEFVDSVKRLRIMQKNR